MAKPSVYKQVDAVQVQQGPFTFPSPRMWNCSILKYKGRLWMSTRYHLGREHASRCATALMPLDRKTFQPIAMSQHLNLPAIVGDEHFEDARLFMYKGIPHISYTQMSGYKPGVDYKCIMKYARLKLLGTNWKIEEVFWPQYGRNHGDAKEKNWAFFESDGKLYCVYQDDPQRTVVQVEGDKIVAEYSSKPASWPWGIIRGGAPPIPWCEGKMLAIFHSSLRTEEAPHFVRYYAGAYIFESKPPFNITAITSRPLFGGSEADGHGEDPRYSDGWKPYVVFPGGCVPEGDRLLVAFGVNDWQCAIGKIDPTKLELIQPDRSDAPARYFTTTNGSLAVRAVGPDGEVKYIPWDIPRSDRRGAMAPKGYYATKDGREAEVVADAPRVEEITAEQYRIATGKAV